MLLRFNVTMEDLVAFNRHYVARTSFLLALKIVVMAVGSLVIVGRALSHITDTSDPTRIAVGLGIGWGVGFTMAAVYCVIIHYLFRWLADSTVRFMYRAGKNKGVLGLHEIEIDPQGLTERTDVNDSKYTWHGVETIAETDDYLFIYITTMTAHIIPKHRVIHGDLPTFTARTKEYWLAAHSTNTP